MTRQSERPSRSRPANCSATKRTTSSSSTRCGTADDRGHAGSCDVAEPSRRQPVEAWSITVRDRSGPSADAASRPSTPSHAGRGHRAMAGRRPPHRSPGDRSQPDGDDEGERSVAARGPRSADDRQEPLGELLRAVGADLRAGVAEVRVGEAAAATRRRTLGPRTPAGVGHLEDVVDQAAHEPATTGSATASAIVVHPASRPP